ncbi:ShlB/FhaC/HecB family hemolysin secretion/activation protein [Hyphomicrobium sp. NDB2Meth4]|uniref:ShlB/FhaC/HecB family hemolysin secretion/activation protein n=1 Tax=Hyphomicrobium sp. NDB2Meth4 TaxID=1892846 RepID=UPI000930E8A4|nr:ShlB/FhaC/HecB family hemolysin secretion/activation protein [Hyphomicrobium sp. NDB2Meth4]
MRRRSCAGGLRTAAAVGVLALFAGAAGAASDEKSTTSAQQVASADAAQPPPFDVYEFRIDGADHLVQAEVEGAVYPFLGPQKTPQDIEKARAALEKAYHDKGLQTVSVSVPQQNVEAGTVVLVVTEGKVGNLRVKNSRYFDQDLIKRKAPSLQEGVLPNFNDVTKDLIALSQWPDRRVTPALRAGVTPGTVDVDLTVEDKLPLHASVELNNRQSPNTTPLRLNTSIRYDNLWQRGHSLSLSYQTSPEQRDEVEVFSGSYLGRLTDWTSILVYGVDSSSNVATVGGMNIVGPGQVLGTRALLTLPALDGFYHSLSFGIDYKHFGQIVELGSDSFSSPITYYPLTASYSTTWQGEKVLTQANFGATFNWRGPGSDFEEFWIKRAYAESNFFHANVDVQHTREIAHGFQIFAKAQTQISDGPLVSSEQFSIGGWDTVRGYLESEAIGDTGVAGSLELRSPDIAALLQKRRKDEGLEMQGERPVFNEFRLFAFVDGAAAMIHSPLPEQDASYRLWSLGVGARFKMLEYLDGSVALAVPMTTETTTTANEPRVLFSVTGGF